MPVYTLRNNRKDEYYEVTMSYDEFKKFLEENKDFSYIPKMPATVTGRMSTHRMAGGEWQDVLKKIKKGSGRDNKINV